ncbi:J domain-containing protein [Kibdelosporangium aridum]|uniref:J domain-containing protein n=1 Tax=Kibdelosporangium aridum TaxID=2030 RepID=UPI000689D331
MDPYRVLGVAPDATAAQITASYRAKVLALHPDTRPETAEPARLADVLAAYALLRDPQRRAAYDAKHTTCETRIEVRVRRVQQAPDIRLDVWPEPDIRVGPVRRLS